MVRLLARRWANFFAIFVLGATSLCASGPRFVTGPPFFTGTPGLPIGWKQTTLLYSTDPGSLGPFVDHAASDALVAAAAGAWNVPVAAITAAQGASLAEHVSGQNVYFSASGLTLPNDVSSANSANVPVAVVYDTDGSVTEILLGSGASDPSGCQQNAVTETVDQFDPAGYIEHAIVIINGRCTGAAPERQLQLQYQLERVFGRILGLAWSQLNDNVFTGNPTPNVDQALHWPIMHPIDILCGPYSYQCLPQPFTLRPDDIAGLVGLYPIANNATPPPGKQISFANAHPLAGSIQFPTGEGMSGVNVLVKRQPRYASYFQDWYETSAVSGSTFRLQGVSAFEAAGTGFASSFGALGTLNQQDYFIPYVDITGPYPVEGELVSLESINPLYIGDASIGPFSAGMVSPAGTAPEPTGLISGPLYGVEQDFMIADAPSTCGDGTDGTPNLPAELPSSGWWNGVTCGYGHSSYYAAAIKAQRSFTVEVTALDEAGFATTAKLMPVIGLFAPSDAPGALPSLGAALAAFNSSEIGTTSIQAVPFAGTATGGTIQIGIGDQRGDGRPDFGYQARLFYADALVPAAVPVSGGSVAISGTGFRAGNEVSINGVPVMVSSWTSNSILLSTPEMATAGATAGVPVDVAVTDLSTGAVSTMTAALTYGANPGSQSTLSLILQPSGLVYAGEAAATPFSVEALAADGVTPAVAQPVSLSFIGGSGQFAGCPAPCSILTDQSGRISVNVIPSSAGEVTLQAALGGATVLADFAAIYRPAQMRLEDSPATTAMVGSQATGDFKVQVVTANETGIAGELITFTATQGTAALQPCNTSPCSMTTNRYGQAWMTITPTSAGPVTITASDGNLTQSVNLTDVQDIPQMSLVTGLNATAYIPDDLGRLRVRLVHGDGVAPITDVTVQLTAPPGIVWDACGSNDCETTTDWNGVAASSPRGTRPGTYTLSVAYQGVSLSFTATILARQASLTIVSAPSGTIPAGVHAATPFAVQLLDGFGNPIGGAQVNLGGVQNQVLAGCNTGNCILFTDSNGIVSTSITPLVPGNLVLSATWASLDISTSFVSAATPVSFQLVSGPAPAVLTGDRQTFRYHATGLDGISPLQGLRVFLYVSQGVLTLDGCPFATCSPSTDANGNLTLTSTPFVPGPVTLVAVADGIVQTDSFTVLPRAAMMKVVSAPTGNAVEGTSTSSAFTVQVLEADGATPVSGSNVTFAVASGSAGLGACASPPCVVSTDAHGLASTSVMAGTSPGPVLLSATDNSFTAKAGFTVFPPDVLSVSLNIPVYYLAEEAVLNLPETATAVRNGTAVAGQTLAWTGSMGLVVANATSITDAGGHASMQVTAGPLAASVTAAGQACAWVSVCGNFSVAGVAAADQKIAVVEGGQQVVTGGAAFSPLMAAVTDAIGHPVAGATVTVGQTVYASSAPCPATGRCPAEAILASGASTLTSDTNGHVSVQPMVVPGQATTTAIELSVGTRGFATARLSSTP